MFPFRTEKYGSTLISLKRGLVLEIFRTTRMSDVVYWLSLQEIYGLSTHSFTASMNFLYN